MGFSLHRLVKSPCMYHVIILTIAIKYFDYIFKYRLTTNKKNSTILAWSFKSITVRNGNRKSRVFLASSSYVIFRMTMISSCTNYWQYLNYREISWDIHGHFEWCPQISSVTKIIHRYKEYSLKTLIIFVTKHGFLGWLSQQTRVLELNNINQELVLWIMNLVHLFYVYRYLNLCETHVFTLLLIWFI